MWKKHCVFIVITNVGGEITLKLPARSSIFFCYASTTESQKANGWLSAGCTFLEVELRVTGWEIKTARSWHETQQATTGQDRQVRLLVLSVGVGTANMRNKPVQPQPRRTSDSTSCLNHEADQICTWYRPLTSSRHVNFQRCVFSDQTWRRLASGVRRVCRHVFQISAKLWIIQRKFKKENVAGRSGPTGESAAWTPSPERGASAARLRAQRARRSSPTLPTTHLCLLLRDAPPGICFLLLLFYRKSHREMMRGLSSRSAALLFRRALVSWLTAHPVCARRRSCSALSAHGCCCIGCKFKKKKKEEKGGSTMTSSRWATWALTGKRVH